MHIANTEWISFRRLSQIGIRPNRFSVYILHLYFQSLCEVPQFLKQLLTSGIVRWQPKRRSLIMAVAMSEASRNSQFAGSLVTSDIVQGLNEGKVCSCSLPTCMAEGLCMKMNKLEQFFFIHVYMCITKLTSEFAPFRAMQRTQSKVLLHRPSVWEGSKKPTSITTTDAVTVSLHPHSHFLATAFPGKNSDHFPSRSPATSHLPSHLEDLPPLPCADRGE
jgi:hypothetical protein